MAEPLCFIIIVMMIIIIVVHVCVCGVAGDSGQRRGD